MAWDNEFLNGVYDYASFSLSTGQTNYDVRSNQAALFNRIPQARSVVIWTDQDITVRFNNTTFPAVPVLISESPAEFMKKLLVRDIYITNQSGSTATIKIMLLV